MVLAGQDLGLARGHDGSDDDLQEPDRRPDLDKNRTSDETTATLRHSTQEQTQDLAADSHPSFLVRRWARASPARLRHATLHWARALVGTAGGAEAQRVARNLPRLGADGAQPQGEAGTTRVGAGCLRAAADGVSGGRPQASSATSFSRSRTDSSSPASVSRDFTRPHIRFVPRKLGQAC